VRFTEQTRAQARSTLVRFMPEPVADSTLELLSTPVRQVSPVVAELLGRPGRTFAEWATDNAAAFK
jgi:hypothetical protein